MSNYPQIPGIGEGDHHGAAEISKRTFKAAVAVAVGEQVAMSVTEDDGITVFLADTDVAGGEFVCGVAVKAVAAGDYGEFQTKGLFVGLVGSLTNGEGCFPSATAGAAGNNEVSSQETAHPFAVCLDATTGTVFLDCFGG
jgi:hypothetical protein